LSFFLSSEFSGQVGQPTCFCSAVISREGFEGQGGRKRPGQHRHSNPRNGPKKKTGPELADGIGPIFDRKSVSYLTILTVISRIQQ